MALKDSLAAHWSLEEASGSRADDFGSNTLTDNNTVTQAVGKVGSAAQFTAANSESLSRASNAALSITGALWIGGWIYLDSVGSSRAIVSKMNADASTGYLVYWTGSNLAFQTRIGGVARTASGPALSASTWYRVDAWYDPTTQTNNIQVNNGSIASIANTVGVGADTTTFYIGNAPFGIATMDGRLDQFHIHTRIPTTAEKTELYNGGSGLAFSQWSGTYTLSGSGAIVATGSGTGLGVTAPVYTLSGTGALVVTGSGAGLAVTAPSYTLSGSGTVVITGTGTGLSVPFTLSGTGAIVIAGSGAGLVVTSNVFTLSGTGAIVVSGTGAGLVITAPAPNVLTFSSYGVRLLTIEPDHLLAYWSGQDTSGTTATDASENDRDGTYHNVTLGVTGIGDGSTAMGFNGTDSALDAYTESLATAWVGGEFTFSLWFKIPAAVWINGLVQRVIHWQVNASNRIMTQKAAALNTLTTTYIAGGTNKTITTENYSPTDWVHYALTVSKSGNAMRLYLGGLLVDTETGIGTWAGALTSLQTVFGALSPGTPLNPFQGTLAHIAVWDTPLTAEDVAELAAVFGTATSPPERTYMAPFVDRTYVVPAQNRTVMA